MLLYGVSCWLVGRRIPILRTEFSYAEPAHSAEYRLMYCADLSFDRPNTAITFDASYLDLPVVQNERIDQGVPAHGAGEHLVEIQEWQQPHAPRSGGGCASSCRARCRISRAWPTN